MSIAVEALLQHDPGTPELPDETVERLVSHVHDMVIALGQESECAPALTKAVETAVANGRSAEGRARLRKILDRH